VVITPAVPKPEVTPVTPTSTNFCVATQGSDEQKALLDAIAWAEGTRQKYNVMFAGKEFSSYASHPVQTGEMPAEGITANGYTSTAAGRYQFLFKTFKGLQDMGYFSSGFAPPEQDVAAIALVESKGVFDNQLKLVDENSFVSVLDKLAPVWASLPYSPKGGQSYYGQPVQSKSDLLNVYQSCLQFHQTGAVPVSTLPSTGEAKFSDAGYKASGGGWLCPENAPQPNAGLTEDEQFNGCPKGMIKINNFCIDKYEASLVKMDGTPWSPYCDPKIHNVQVKAVSLAGAVPQSNINQLQAKAACENAGKRLCADAEWSRACQGPQGSTYPYGSTYSAGTCNRRDASIHVVARLISEHPEYFPGLLPPPGGQNAWNTQPYMQHPALNQQSNTLTETGEKIQCVSADGVYDLYGNVYEWTADPEGTFRGDYYQLTPRSAANEGCLNTVTGHAAAYSDYSIGFRCCADPLS
jgi:muramidase (phage lysozyme)